VIDFVEGMFMKNFFSRLVCSLLVLQSSHAFAVSLGNLYEIDVPLNAEEQDLDRAILAKKAMSAMLVRAAGSDKILQNAKIEIVLEQADKYLNQLSYQQKEGFDGTFVKVSFNEKKLKPMLQSLPVSLWSSERPLTLIWLRFEGESPKWMGEDAEATFIHPLYAALKTRGIPYLLPLLDLTDIAEIQSVMKSPDTLDFSSFKEAITRYQPDAILLGTLKQEGQSFQSTWICLQSGEKTTWQVEAPALTPLYEEMAENLRLAFNVEKAKGSLNQAEKFSKTFLQTAATEPLSVNVIGVANAEQFTKILELFRKMPIVLTAEVTEVKPEKTTFSLVINSSLEALKQSIQASGVLVESMPDGFDPQSMTYKITGI
jgi:hypothetical protein